MPQINEGEFDGMKVTMNYSEHNPPHFNVDFQGSENHREALMWNWEHPEAMKRIPSPKWK